MTLVWKKAPVRGGPLLLLLAIADYANERGEAWPSIESLAQRCRTSTRTIQRNLSALAVSGLVEVAPNAGQNGTNKYRLRRAVLKGGDILSGGGDKPGPEMSPNPSGTIYKSGDILSPPSYTLCDRCECAVLDRDLDRHTQMCEEAS